MATKNAVLKAIVEGIVVELMVKSGGIQHLFGRWNHHPGKQTR